MKIVVLDGYTLNPGDLSWEALASLGELIVYDRTSPEELPGRAMEAEILLTNKTPLTAESINLLPNLQYIGVLATGYNVVDTAAAAARGVTVTNIPAYGTESVAQFVFALMLELCHHAGRHDASVKAGDWSRSRDFCYTVSPLIELSGRTLGLIGLGRIGTQTAHIARAFGMRVLAAGSGRTTPAPSELVEWVELDTLLRESDIISLHCPATPQTQGLINRERIALMKESAMLINTARGQLVVEQDLADALNAGRISGAALDVLSTEPPDPANPLLTARGCILTPHIAWATREARARLMDTAAQNVQHFLDRHPRNVVN